MTDQAVTTNRILTVAGAILFSVVGWMFNKIIQNIDAMADTVVQLQITQAVLDERIEDMEDCE